MSIKWKEQGILLHHQTLSPFFADLRCVFFHCNWGSRALPRRLGQCQLMIYASLRNAVQYLREILFKVFKGNAVQNLKEILGVYTAESSAPIIPVVRVSDMIGGVVNLIL